MLLRSLVDGRRLVVDFDHRPTSLLGDLALGVNHLSSVLKLLANCSPLWNGEQTVTKHRHDGWVMSLAARQVAGQEDHAVTAFCNTDDERPIVVGHIVIADSDVHRLTELEAVVLLESGLLLQDRHEYASVRRIEVTQQEAELKDHVWVLCSQLVDVWTETRWSYREMLYTEFSTRPLELAALFEKQAVSAFKTDRRFGNGDYFLHALPFEVAIVKRLDCETDQLLATYFVYGFKCVKFLALLARNVKNKHLLLIGIFLR